MRSRIRQWAGLDKWVVDNEEQKLDVVDTEQYTISSNGQWLIDNDKWTIGSMQLAAYN